MLVAQGDGPGVDLSPVTGFVVNEAHGLHRLGVVQSDGEGALVHAAFTTALIAVEKNVVHAGMAQHIDTGIAGDLFGAIAPEDDFLL